MKRRLPSLNHGGACRRFSSMLMVDSGKSPSSVKTSSRVSTGFALIAASIRESVGAAVRVPVLIRHLAGSVQLFEPRLHLTGAKARAALADANRPAGTGHAGPISSRWRNALAPFRRPPAWSAAGGRRVGVMFTVRVPWRTRCTVRRAGAAHGYPASQASVKPDPRCRQTGDVAATVRRAGVVKAFRLVVLPVGGARWRWSALSGPERLRQTRLRTCPDGSEFYAALLSRH